MNLSNFESPTYYNNITSKEERVNGNPNTAIMEPNQITFINCTHKYCVCFVDIVDSTKNTNNMMSSDKIQRYYSIFLNTMSNIVRAHNGRVVKNSGDGLLYYFPRTVNSKDELAFKNVLECGLAMIEEHSSINSILKTHGLPSVSYRISACYGNVELAYSPNSHNVDLFGPPINICSKINRFASANQMIIHNDLYEVITKTPTIGEYDFRDVEGFVEHYYTNQKSLFQTYSVNRIQSGHKTQETKRIKKDRLIETQYIEKNLPNSSFNILLIDDDEDILFAFKSILASEGYNVTTFSNPLRALNHFSEKNPYFYHLIIMDVRMPELNGIKLYSHLKILNPDVKVIFLSALNALDEVLSIFPEINTNEIIRKPIEPKILLSNIYTVSRNHKQNIPVCDD